MTAARHAPSVITPAPVACPTTLPASGQITEPSTEVPSSLSNDSDPAVMSSDLAAGSIFSGAQVMSRTTVECIGGDASRSAEPPPRQNDIVDMMSTNICSVEERIDQFFSSILMQEVRRLMAENSRLRRALRETQLMVLAGWETTPTGLPDGFDRRPQRNPAR